MIRYGVVSSRVVSYKVVGIKNSSKTVVSKSDSGRYTPLALSLLAGQRYITSLGVVLIERRPLVVSLALLPVDD